MSGPSAAKRRENSSLGGCARLCHQFRIARAAQALIDVDVLLQRQRSVEHGFHALHPVLFDRHADLARMRRGLLDDVLADLVLAAPEQHVVPGEVRMTEHVRRDQHVLRRAVALREIGATRIAREHDFEQPRQPHAVLDQLVDVAHAERPVRHAHRQTVDRDLGHEAFRHDLELDAVIVESLLARELLDAGNVQLPVFGHGFTSEARPKKCRTAFQMSSVPLTRYAPTLSSSRAISTNSRPISLSGAAPASGATSRKPAKLQSLDQLFQRCLRLRLVRGEVLAVGGVEQIDVVLARAEARVDDLAHFLQASRGDRAAGAGDAEEFLFLELPRFGRVRDEHQVEVTVLAAQALDRPEEEGLGDLPLALAHAARDVEQQDHHRLHRRLLALGELAIAQIVVGEGGRLLRRWRSACRAA